MGRRGKAVDAYEQTEREQDCMFKQMEKDMKKGKMKELNIRGGRLTLRSFFHLHTIICPKCGNEYAILVKVGEGSLVLTDADVLPKFCPICKHEFPAHLEVLAEMRRAYKELEEQEKELAQNPDFMLGFGSVGKLPTLKPTDETKEKLRKLRIKRINKRK